MWDDDYVYELEQDEKLLWVFLITNDKVKINGTYEISISYIYRMTRVSKDRILQILKKFEKDDKLKFKNGWISIKNFSKHQSASPKITEGIKREVADLPLSVAKWAYPIHRLSYHTINSNSNFNLNLNSNLTSKDEYKERKIYKKKEKRICPDCRLSLDYDSPSCNNPNHKCLG